MCQYRFYWNELLEQSVWLAWSGPIVDHKDVVKGVPEKHYYPDPSGGDGPSWLTVLGHTKDYLWSVDLFRCESIRLQTHWVLVVKNLFTPPWSVPCYPVHE